jgi:hypothetical protein
VEAASGCDAFNGGDGCPVAIGGQNHARGDRFAVQQHGARAAVAGVTAPVRAAQIKIVPQNVQQSPARINEKLASFAIHCEGQMKFWHERDIVGEFSISPIL